MMQSPDFLPHPTWCMSHPLIQCVHAVYAPCLSPLAAIMVIRLVITSTHTDTHCTELICIFFTIVYCYNCFYFITTYCC